MTKYEYGEVILPGFPSGLDNYPCAFIVQNKESERYILICTETEVHASRGEGDITGIMLFPDLNPGRAFECSASSIMWSASTDLDDFMTSGESRILVLQDTEYDFIWTNTDIGDTLGNVYVKASEPVFISGFDLQSWLNGYALGLAGKPLPFSRGGFNG